MGIVITVSARIAMAALVKPVAKCVYVCDDVVEDPASGKVSVLNLWDTVRVPVGAALPYTLPRLCVFVWWRDGQGKVKTHIDIVQASTEALIRRTRACVLDLRERTSSVYARYRIQNCGLPAFGFYHVELYCEDEFVDDQIINVVPARGESS
jgi:hypothetical protein